MIAQVLGFGDGTSEGDPRRRDLLGGKGAGLAEMARLGLPVPPGFTLTTDVCARFRANHALPEDTKAAVRVAIGRLEQSLGRSFGGDVPLLVSVRSGARALVATNEQNPAGVGAAVLAARRASVSSRLGSVHEKAQ